ncbi:MAG: alpha/beta fold hydrolase [Anaerolineae bacterium]
MNEIAIKTPRGEIFGMTAGPENGPVVICVHGWSQKNGWHTWKSMLAPLGAVGYRVISVDMPGWGKSAAWGKTAGKSAVVAMLDSLGVQTAHALVGKSWGGGVCLDFAMTHPTRVKKLVLTAPAYRGDLSILTQRLTTPVLLAWAKNDKTIPIAWGEKLQAAIPNCQFELYEEGEHEAAQHNIKDFAPKAIDLLSRESNAKRQEQKG